MVEFHRLRQLPMVSRTAVLAVLLCCASTASCVSISPTGKTDSQAVDPGTAERLAGTKWRLVEIQSMDDAIGTARPSDRNLYTLDLNADGKAAMRLNCNRGAGQWSAKPVGNGATGNFSIGPLAMTRALCPPPSLDQRVARDMTFVRSFLLKDGRLYLSLMADGGIYVWEPRGDGN